MPGHLDAAAARRGSSAAALRREIRYSCTSALDRPGPSVGHEHRLFRPIHQTQVRRPFAILAWVFFALLIACGSLVAVGFGVSSETNYDWDVQDDVYTIRLAMVESAHDRTDREFIAERSDET